MKTWILCIVLLVCLGFLTASHSQTLPAPMVDRVGFPQGYKDKFKLFYVFDNPQNRQIRAVYGNDIAASARPEYPFFFPYGSILLFEDYPARLDAEGNPVLDENGRFIREALRTIFVMRKEPGFGEEYQQLRNGEWEYVAYRPDGSYATMPQNSGSCAQCHLLAGQPRDWVFRSAMYFQQSTGAVPDLVAQHYRYLPNTVRVKAGSTVTIYNDDELDHTFSADDRSFDSGVLHTGASFTVKATQTGEINFHCNIHSRMRGKIVVE